MEDRNNDAAAAATGMDRLAPGLRPPGRPVMYQQWADLLFLHWEVDPDMLRAGLPPGLELDLFEGRAYVGLVPFAMRRVRPRWAPAVRGLSDFAETNVRTYVHAGGRDPGVWFQSLDAANPVAVAIARATYHLPYHHARMRAESRADGTLAFASERLWPGPKPATCRVEARPEGSPRPAEPGTLEHFLAERYILYAHARGRLFRGRVHHTPYPLQPACVTFLAENLIAAAGIVRPQVPPLAHHARGVTVDVFPLERCRVAATGSL